MVADKIGFRNSAYILPNLMTAFNLICGLLAVIMTLETFNNQHPAARYNLAAWFIMAAMVFDFLDGKVARWTRTVSQFGVKIDSLTDFVSFGVAPVIIVYTSLLQHTYLWLQIISSGLYLIAGAWRLARFNCKSFDSGSSTHFIGLPIPAAAVFICSVVLACKGPAESIAPKLLGRSFSAFSPEAAGSLAGGLMLGLAFLMVSHIPFPAFKHTNRRNMIIFAGVALFLAVLSFLLPFENIIFLIILIYLFIGVFQYFLEKVIQQNTRPKGKNRAK